MTRLKRAAAIAAIIVSAVSASCADMVHAKEKHHDDMGSVRSIPG